MLCMLFVQSGQFGVGCVPGDILCIYSMRKGDLSIRSCASNRLVYFESVSSVLSMGGAVSPRSLLCGLLRRCCSVICVWIVLMFCFIVVCVVSFGCESMLIV